MLIIEVLKQSYANNSDNTFSGKNLQYNYKLVGLTTSRAFFVVCLVGHVKHSSFFTVHSNDYNGVIHKERM